MGFLLALFGDFLPLLAESYPPEAKKHAVGDTKKKLLIPHLITSQEDT